MSVIGIDPGLSGAIAILRDDGSAEVYDAPTMWVPKGKGRRREYLLGDVLDTLRLAGITVAAIEAVSTRPGQSAQSSLSIGYGKGIYLMGLTALSIPFEIVTPQRWKGVMLDGVGKDGKDKVASRLAAQRLFPKADLGSRKDQGRAEALLIAEYRRRQG